MCADERFEWKTLVAVESSNYKITGVYPIGYDGIYRYVNDIDRCGFMTEDRILTKPLYTAHVVPKDPENGLFVATMASGYMNTFVLIDVTRNCKILLNGFSCSFWLDKEKGLLAYRIDSPLEKWPRNMSWGVYDVKAEKIVMRPQNIKLSLKKGSDVRIEAKIQRLLAASTQ